ncbi:hypothetical protein Pst134EA_022990 [Puccinia striiformis f. sp. tritici]|uniref:hypothetical protein n=1 Tax=Puccinia striiformis f. sp. tritici TaxID=168172 RepID=UPI002007A35C|nr:hypothetical protein Pst134EA_022990 [Puccinia striiformis f. sp. tritici]KAH9446022.1 hypothetical protein Pst134EB_023843 [Puccinia striiformis f. sp. tritici]KAH9455530.1 hypothetical protein Pst134EA_022990 [Puccinia striiformis f. sp. tritici]
MDSRFTTTKLAIILVVVLSVVSGSPVPEESTNTAFPRPIAYSHLMADTSTGHHG